MKNQINVQEYVYDFAKDGGAVSTITLSSKNGKNPLPVGAIVKAVTAQVVTACTGGAGSTIAWGNNTVDGYSGTTAAVAGFTQNALFNGWDNAASLLFDDANDHPIPFYVTSESTTGTFTISIGTDPLTAGKIVFMVEYLLPAITL